MEMRAWGSDLESHLSTRELLQRHMRHCDGQHLMSVMVSTKKAELLLSLAASMTIFTTQAQNNLRLI